MLSFLTPAPGRVNHSLHVVVVWQSLFEPQHDKTNKMSVRPAKIQISLGIHPVWSESVWIAEDLSFLQAGSENSDQTVRMPRLIWVFAGHTLILLVLSCRGSFCFCKLLSDPFIMREVLATCLPDFCTVGISVIISTSSAKFCYVVGVAEETCFLSFSHYKKQIWAASW